MQHPTLESTRVAIIGLGYVGLPLAVALGKRYPTLGFDLNEARVAQLKAGKDTTGEVDQEALTSAPLLSYSCDEAALKECNVYIVAVPTPIDSSRRPNLAPLVSASQMIGRAISPGDVVIYESTVYPGATEEDCLPVVEAVSGLTFNTDFYAGYSPERINPGDKTRPLTKILKVTSGSTPEVADYVDALYDSVIEAGTFKASSIRVAEAAKVIENTQRDVNIALINELSIIFSHLGIDTNEVINAAATKWNFIRLQPGLVGGHCIGVDPYYLLHKASSKGYIPDIIRTARQINDGMARNAASRLVKAMIDNDLHIKGAKILVAGFTFKENCPDIRNTKVIDLIEELESYGMEVQTFDTWADPAEVAAEYGVQIGTSLPAAEKRFDAVIVTVAHDDVVSQGAAALRTQLKDGGLIFDLKAVFPAHETDLRL